MGALCRPEDLYSPMTDNVKLYKYLDVNGGLMMLHYGNLQFTNATRLNDPFDCHPSLFDFSNAPTNQQNWPPVDFLKEKGLLDMGNLRNSAWICSLSKVYDSLLMWTYYGNHKGVCIGLDIEKAEKHLSKIRGSVYGGARKIEVQYREVIEKPDYFHNSVDFMHYLLSTKAKAWEHEQEVRLVLLNPIPASEPNHPYYAPMGLPHEPKNRNEPIDWRETRAYPRLGDECFDSLYLGIKIDDEEKDKIIKVARKRNPAIKIYQMTIDSDAFRLKEEKIHL